MTSPFPQTAWHVDEDLLTGYATGTIESVAAWSVEAHLAACAQCRSALSAQVDAGRLARNRSVILVRAATPDGRLLRLVRRCGVPDHVPRLLAATPSLRLSWLLSVAGVLVTVLVEAAAVRYGWIAGPGPGPGPGPAGPAGYQGPMILVPFLLVAPLLVLAGVATAFLPAFDPASQLAVAAPFSGFTLLLVRAVCALAAALVPVLGGALVLPGPGWLPFALLLPSLALCAFALAAATVVGPRAAAAAAGALWALPALLLAVTRLPLALVQWHAQSAFAAVLCVCIVVLVLRRDRLELGWMR
jgi:hypothetical protein